MKKRKKTTLLLLVLLIGVHVCSLTGCGRERKPLVVYAGKGLKPVMEEIKQAFEQNHDTGIKIIYAGSNTLLTTIQKTRKGDVFVPGSRSLLEDAGDLVAHSQFVARHVPAVAVRRDNPKTIRSFDDLLAPGIQIAVGNEDMCAIAGIAVQIFIASGKQTEFSRNIAITGSTVNELLDLVIQGEVDAAIVWLDMMTWPEAKDLVRVEIPDAVNIVHEIHVATLATTVDRKSAALFADFVAHEGKSIFIRHGFGEQ